MKIFLTGATGFIGSHVMEGLLRRGDKVFVLSRKGADNPHLKDRKDPNLQIVTGDLLLPESYVAALENCEAVIHIAGWIDTRRRNMDKLREINVTATENLWKSCAKTRPEKIVYLASIFAHGWGEGDRPCDETTPFDPAIARLEVPYFLAKREAEMMSWHFLEKKKLPIVFGYPGFCIGPGDWYLSSMRVVEQFMKGLLPAYLNGGMNFLDVRDAADGLIGCLDHGKVGEKYMLGDHNLRWKEFFGILAEVSGKRPPLLTLPYKPTRLLGAIAERVWAGAPLNRGDVDVMKHIWYYDPTKARTQLGLPTRPLRDSLKDGLAWLAEAGFIK